MMDGKKAFRVAVIADLSERERQILATATRLTTARTRSYIFEFSAGAPADIYLVDGDMPEKQTLWHLARAQHPAPTLFLTTEPRDSSGRREFRRPIVPSCLLSLVNVLDEITVQELHYLPELSIGHEGAMSATSSVAITAPGRRFSALVVDDSSTVQAQVGLGLRMFGATADFADTAGKALDLIERNDYDIAFLDVVLPGGADGYQVCKAIKKDRRTRHTTVIMLTGKSSTFDRVKASLAGCDAFLTKPVQNEVFQQVLRKYLNDEGEVALGQAVHAK